MKLLAVSIATTVLVLAPAALAAMPLTVGVTEDGLKFEPAATRRDATALGLAAVRITLTWRRGQAAPDAAQRGQLAAATGGAGPLRILLSVFGERARDAPQTAAERDQYCEFVRRVVAAYPAIHDVVIWNEPNKQRFWSPQFAPDGRSLAPARYEALLARCWDVLHDQLSGIDVLAPSTAPRGNDNPDARSNVSHSPRRFFEELGAAYRASGRDRPIFDTVAHHVHGTTSREAPWQRHGGGTIGEGDYAKLVDTLQRAFRGTAQPVPGHCVNGRCADIWYVEAGFQTLVPPSKRSAYTGREARRGDIPVTGGSPNQADQLTAALRLAACQPHVTAYFNFLLWDQPGLAGWRSGLYWADRTPKPSVPAFRAVVDAVHSNGAACPALRRRLPDARSALGPQVLHATTTTATTTGSQTTTSATSTVPTTTSRATTSGTTTPSAGAGGRNDTLIVAGAIAAAALAFAAILLAARRLGRRRRKSR